jgi:hypothetical protein
MQIFYHSVCICIWPVLLIIFLPVYSGELHATVSLPHQYLLAIFLSLTIQGQLRPVKFSLVQTLSLVTQNTLTTLGASVLTYFIYCLYWHYQFWWKICISGVLCSTECNWADVRNENLAMEEHDMTTFYEWRVRHKGWYRKWTV